jgi:phosphoribosylaminoimidazole carboxylase PurE protein
MGSDSDLPVMSAACRTLEELQLPFETSIVSAHRTPERMVEFATGAVGRGIQVIIAGAGGAAHLPGMVAAMTPLPVIGVPVRASNLEGLDSLLSIVQMPRGVPVATVAINNAQNAALLAARIIGVADERVQRQVADWAERARSGVEEKALRLEQMGWSEFLDKRTSK